VNTPIRFNLLQRDFLLHVPPGYHGDSPLPLLLVMHGAFSTAVQTERETGFSALADRENFLVAYPEGIGLFGFLQHWNAGHCCGKAAAEGVNDVAFVDAVIAEVRRRLSLDPQRIYMAGMSNGGMFTYRYAAERTTTLAAAAVVAGAIGSHQGVGGASWQLPAPDETLPLIIFHGLSDDHVPAAGGKSPLKGGERAYSSVAEAAAFWGKADRCQGKPENAPLSGGGGWRQQWSDCARDSAVEVNFLTGWEHQWPAPYFTDGLPPDNPLRGFDASAQIWNFLRRYRRDINGQP
jgi:polyhydroxybutyrate depolymerase